jgi:hypothetical protein
MAQSSQKLSSEEIDQNRTKESNSILVETMLISMNSWKNSLSRKLIIKLENRPFQAHRMLIVVTTCMKSTGIIP